MRIEKVVARTQADAIGQWTGGPAIGALGTVTSIRVALVAATACVAVETGD